MTPEQMMEHLVGQLLSSAMVDSTITNSDMKAIILKEASEQYGSGDEFFDGWLPLTLAANGQNWGYSEQELTTIRNASRVISATNELQKNCLNHYRNFVVGEGFQLQLFNIGDTADLLKETKPDSKIRKLMDNWKAFSDANNLDERIRNWVPRKHRDGEVIAELFKGEVPALRFIDPEYIFSKSDTKNSVLGIVTDGKDKETPLFYEFEDTNTQGSYRKIKAENIIHDKANVDFDAPRGIPTGWPIFTNLRRVEKLLVNVSILSAIHSAIAFVRTTPGATQAQVAKLLSANRDKNNSTRTSGTTGNSINARGIKGGTVLSANDGTKYEFPAHNVDPSRFAAVIDKEIGHIAAGWTLPVKWLLADEPTEPLTPGSPVIANFNHEQATMSSVLVKLFWKVQAMMGVKVETLKPKLEVVFVGPRLAVGKALDEARVDDLALKNGTTSVQEVVQKYGGNYFITRRAIIQHRATRQPGEVMPGESGNTNPTSDGLTKADNQGQRTSDPAGGNNKV